MKKRIVVMILCAAVLCALLTAGPGAAEDRLNFISINDTLPPELINAAIDYGGMTYVPYWLFTNYGFGIYYTYFAGNATAYLFNGERQLFFELSSGRTYDGDDYYYSATAILRGGTVYLPLNFTCSFFDGISYSNIGGNEYGTILRVTNGTAVLTDVELLRYARSMMRSYYQNYNKTETPPPETTAPPATPTPRPNEGNTALLGLVGLPTEETLELLRQLGMKACFFLTEEEVLDRPDTVRQLACSGFGLGVDCLRTPEADGIRTAALIWETARVRTILTILPPEAETPAGMTAYRAELRSVAPGGGQELSTNGVLGKLDAVGDTSLLLGCDDDKTVGLRMVLHQLRDEGYVVAAPREIDGMA